MEQLEEARTDSESENELEILDTTQLLNFLPVEIWRHVTTKIPQRHQHDNLENLSNSSLFYRNLFDGQKTKFLFGKVLNILIRNNHLQQLTDVLNCRPVCKVWNEEVDKILGQKKCKLLLKKRLNVFHTHKKLQKFLDHFEATHFKSQINRRSPFIGTKVTLVINDELDWMNPDIRELSGIKLDLTSKIMERYGSHIKTISISFSTLHNQIMKNGFAKMSDWLLRMDNLAHLSVSNSVSPIQGNMLSNVLIKSYPKLSKLETIRINKCVPDDVGMDLLKNNSHIRKLTIETRTHSTSTYDYQITNFPVLSNLEELDIDLNSIGKIGNLSNLNFPHLSTLTLVPYRRDNFYEQTRWSEIFPVLEKEFGGTLERLCIEFKSQDRQVLLDTSSCQLNLPKLKEIRLIVNETTINLDFMWPMKGSLERICVMIVEKGNVEGVLVKMLPFHHIWIRNVKEVPRFAHFDKTYEDIKYRINGSRLRSLGKRDTIGDMLILR